MGRVGGVGEGVCSVFACVVLCVLKRSAMCECVVGVLNVHSVVCDVLWNVHVSLW